MLRTLLEGVLDLTEIRDLLKQASRPLSRVQMASPVFHSMESSWWLSSRFWRWMWRARESENSFSILAM